MPCMHGPRKTQRRSLTHAMNNEIYIAVGLAVIITLLSFLRWKEKITSKTFGFSFTVIVTTSVVLLSIAPDLIEVNVSGNTLKALRQENTRAQNILSELSELKSDVIALELKRIAHVEYDVFGNRCDTTTIQNFDTFMFIVSLLENERVSDRLQRDIVPACNALLAYQQDLTAMHFAFSESGPCGANSFSGKFSRSKKYPGVDGFRILSMDEMQAELAELEQGIEENPNQSPDDDGNRKTRLIAVENYSTLFKSCVSLGWQVKKQD